MNEKLKKKTKMIRRLLCLLGLHEWILAKETVETKRLGWQQIFWYECKHCGKVKR